MPAARATLHNPPLSRLFRQRLALSSLRSYLPATTRHSCRPFTTFAGMWGRSKPPSKVQILVDLAREVFDGVNIPSDPDIMRVKAALSAIPLEELGIFLEESPRLGTAQSTDRAPTAGSEGGLRFSEGGRSDDADSVLMESSEVAAAASRASGNGRPSPAVQYRHIFEDRQVSLGIFSFSAGASIPLHDHPGMVVISRVLYGSLHVQSYDWREKGPALLGESAYACLARDLVMTGQDEPAALFPARGGNLHQFKAVSPCAVLDILSPPYDSSRGRDCTYYQPQQQQQQQQGREAGILRETNSMLLTAYSPEDFKVTNIPYEGAPVKIRRSWLR